MIDYLIPGDTVDADKLNALYGALDAKASTALNGRNLLWLRAGTSAATLFLHRQVMGRVFLWVGGTRLFSKHLGGSSYDHSGFQTAVNAATVVSCDTDKKLLYLQGPLGLDNCLEAMRRTYTQPGGTSEDYWVVEVGNGILPQRIIQTDQAEIVIENSSVTSIDWPANWNKYNAFRFHNCNPASVAINFKGTDTTTKHTVTVPARGSLCVRRTDVDSGYLDGFTYFQRYRPGDPRSFYWYDLAWARNDSAASGVNPNNIWNCSYLVPFVYFILLGGVGNLQDYGAHAAWAVSFNPLAKLDKTQLKDVSSLLAGIYGDATSSSTILGDLIHHKGKCKVVTVPADAGQPATATDLTFNGYSSLVSDFAAANIAVNINADNWTLQHNDPSVSHYLLACGTNLLNGFAPTFAQRSVIALNSLTTFNCEFAIFDYWGVDVQRFLFHDYPLALTTTPQTDSVSYQDLIISGGSDPGGVTLGTTHSVSATRYTCAARFADPFSALRYHRHTIADAQARLSGLNVKMTLFGPLFYAEQPLELTGPATIDTMDQRPKVGAWACYTQGVPVSDYYLWPNSLKLDAFGELVYDWASFITPATGASSFTDFVTSSFGPPMLLNLTRQAASSYVAGTLDTFWTAILLDTMTLGHWTPRKPRVYMVAGGSSGRDHPSYAATPRSGAGQDYTLGDQKSLSDSQAQSAVPLMLFAGCSVALTMSGYTISPWEPMIYERDIDCREDALQGIAVAGYWLDNSATFIAGGPAHDGLGVAIHERFIKPSLTVESYNAWADLINAITSYKPLNFVDHFAHPDYTGFYVPNYRGMNTLTPNPGVVRPVTQYALVSWNGNSYGASSPAWSAIGITPKTESDFPASFAAVRAGTNETHKFTLPSLTILSDMGTTWATGVAYTVGAGVLYAHSRYTCAVAHTSNSGNAPPGSYWTLAETNRYHYLTLQNPAPGDVTKTIVANANKLRPDLDAISGYQWVAVDDVKSAAESLGYIFLHHQDGVPLILKTFTCGDCTQVIGSALVFALNSNTSDMTGSFSLTDAYGPGATPWGNVSIVGKFAEFVNPTGDDAVEWLASSSATRPSNVHLCDQDPDNYVFKIWASQNQKWPPNYGYGGVILGAIYDLWLVVDIAAQWRKVNFGSGSIQATAISQGNPALLSLEQSSDGVDWDARAILIPWQYFDYAFPYATTRAKCEAKVYGLTAIAPSTVVNPGVGMSLSPIHTTGTRSETLNTPGTIPLLWINYWRPF